MELKMTLHECDVGEVAETIRARRLPLTIQPPEQHHAPAAWPVFDSNGRFLGRLECDDDRLIALLEVPAVEGAQAAIAAAVEAIDALEE